MKRTPLTITLAVVASVIALVCLVPLPHHIDCAFEIQPSETGNVYANTSGMILKTVKAGQHVEEGDILAVLENPELALQRVERTGELNQAEKHLQNLRLQRRRDPSLVSRLQTQTRLISSAREMLSKTEEEIERLTIRAPRAGIVLPPPDKPERDTSSGLLPDWSGSPLKDYNRGALLTPDTLICQIGTADSLEAILIIDQGDIQLVKEGYEVDLKLDSRKTATFSSEIIELSTQNKDYVSSGMSSQTGGALETEIDPQTGQVKPRSVSYQARVALVDTGMPMRLGYRGAAKVHTENKTLGWRLWRIVIKTFNFEL